MADISRTVKILFSGKDEVSVMARRIASSLDTMTGELGRIADPFAGLADGIIGADAALAALAVGGLGMALQKSTEFESAMLDLQKVLGDGESLDEAADAAARLSDKFGESQQDIIKMITGFRQSGYELSDSILIAENSLKLMVAGDMKAEEATQTLVRAMKGFNLEAQNSVKFVELANWASNNYAETSKLLGDALARSAPLSRLFNMSMQEMAAVLTPMVEVFQDSEQAATAFKTGILRLKDQTADAKKAFELLGFSAKEIAGRNMMEYKDILALVAERYKGLEGPMKGVVLEMIFGKEHVGKMAEVMEKWSTVAKIAAADAKEMAVVLEKEITTRLASAENSFKRAAEGLNRLSIAIGDQFRAAAANGASGLADLEAAISKGIKDGAFEPIFSRIRDFGDKAGELFRQIAKAFPDAMAQVDWSKLTSAMDSVAGGLKEFFSGIDLTTADGLAKSIQWVVDSLASLIRVSEGMASQFRPIFDAITEGINQVNQADVNVAQAFGEFLGAAKLVVGMGAEVAGAMFVIKQSSADVESVFNMVVGTARVFVNAIQTAFDSAAWLIADSIAEILRYAEGIASLPGVPESWGQSIRDAREAVLLFRDIAEEDSFEQVGDMLEGASQAMAGFAGEAFDGAAAAREFSVEVNKIPAEKKTTVSLDAAAAGVTVDELTEKMNAGANLDITVNDGALDLVKPKLDAIPAEKKTEVKVTTDPGAVEAVFSTIQYQLEDGTIKEIKVPVAADKESVKKAKSDIEGELDKDELKRFEIQARLQSDEMKADTDRLVAKIKSDSDIIGKMIDWKAKIELAQVEAGVEKMKAAFSSLTATMQSTGNVLNSLFGMLSGEGALFGEKNQKLLAQIEKESRMREEAHLANLELIRVQTESIEIQNELAKKKDPIEIKVVSGDVEPHVQAILMAVLRNAWLATDSRSKFLTMFNSMTPA